MTDNMLDTLTGKYRTIVIDPPWRYGAWGKSSNRTDIFSRPMPYKTMTTDEIIQMPIGKFADINCELYLWTTQHYLPTAFTAIDRWGFKYCQTLTWCKSPRGLGQGGLFCPTTEFLILCRRGKMPIKRRINTTWWHTVRLHNSHSTKPELFQDIIETVSDAPRLELFARRHRDGWTCWGDEVDKGE